MSKRPEVSALMVCVFFLILSQSRCLRVGPDYSSPNLEINIPATFRNISPKGEGKGSVRCLKWEDLFPGLGLKKMVREARRGNWDVKIATQKVIEARLHVNEVRSQRFPQLQVNGSAERQDRRVIGIIPGKTFSAKTDIFVLSAAASYELDLWGKLARANEAAWAEAMEAAENRRTVELTVEAEVVTQCIKLAILQRRMNIAEKRIRNQEKTLKIVETRYERGLSSLLDLKKASGALSQARSQLPVLKKEIAQAGQKLSFLLGHYPQMHEIRSIGPGYVDRLPKVPPGLPSQLLLRRPDVRAAESRLHVLNAEIGVARANRFPSINLTGTYGYSSSELKVLIGPGSKLWSLAAGIVQPIFNAGKLRIAERAAIAKYKQGVAEYGKVVLKAFLDVENALVEREEEMRRRKSILAFLQEAKAAEAVAQRRYRKGLIDYLNLLDAQRTRFEAEDALALVDLAILTNRVTLVRVLGGGWD